MNLHHQDIDAHTEALLRAARQIEPEDETPLRGRGPVRKGDLGSADYYIGLASVFCLCAAFALLLVATVVALDAIVSAALISLGLGMGGILILVLRSPR